MKKLYYTIGVLLIISIISTAVMLILSPDVIPVHYNASGEIDRFGSKYENLIFPGFAVVMVAVFLLLLKHQKRKNVPETEQKVLLGTAIFSLILFNALGLFFGITAINYSSNPVKMTPDLIIKFTSIGTGILLIVFGNFMPKARRNALFGLRTKWSMANDSIWQKSQRFGGFSAVICGLIMIVLSVFIPGIWNVTALIVTVVVWTIACIVASHHYWKTDRNDPNKD